MAACDAEHEERSQARKRSQASCERFPPAMDAAGRRRHSGVGVGLPRAWSWALLRGFGEPGEAMHHLYMYILYLGDPFVAYILLIYITYIENIIYS